MRETRRIEKRVLCSSFFFFVSSQKIKMAEELETSLLNKKDYYENCPGCKVDLHKAGQTGLPIKELFTVWVVILSAGNPSISYTAAFFFFCRLFR